METQTLQEPRIGLQGSVPPSGGSLEIGNKPVVEPPKLIVRTVGSPFGGIPRNWKHANIESSIWQGMTRVPPSGGSLETGNNLDRPPSNTKTSSSPFGGIPRNWKHQPLTSVRNYNHGSPFGGIPRNWKRPGSLRTPGLALATRPQVPPSGGSLDRV